MKNIFKITEYLPDTQQIVVRYARKNTHKNIDEYIESAVDLKQLDLEVGEKVDLNISNNFVVINKYPKTFSSGSKGNPKKFN